ncbi:MAG: putative TPR repeat methyltransferase [Saprospiraceae bacterium]|jgi:predicted TPR repeat methyltransferase
MTKNDSSTPAVGANDFVTEAYNSSDKAALETFYAKWANDYDRQMLDELRYCSPHKISALLQQHLPNKQSKVLDVGCGTGLTIKGLFEAGYTQLHGLDLSEDMVKVATSRGFYQGLKVADVNQPLDYNNEQFDAIISSGTFTHGHAGSEPLIELFRTLKVGGLLACTVHEELWEKLGFSSIFSKLEEGGKVKCLHLTKEEFYQDKAPEGWFCLYEKLRV